MLNSRTFCFTLTEHGTALGVDNILCNGIDHRLTFKINTLNLVTRILGSWIKRDRQVKTCVQPLAEQGETAFQCFLFHMLIFVLIHQFRAAGLQSGGTCRATWHREPWP